LLSDALHKKPDTFRRAMTRVRRGKIMTAKTPYEIGYGRPPKHAQWKKGQSGNPGGRAKKPPNFTALVTTLLAKRVTVRKGRTTARMTRLEHLVERLLDRAIRGDPRLIKMALDEVRRTEARAPEEAYDAAAAAELSRADQEVIKALLARLGHGAPKPEKAAD
jgi:hypothetical protein